MKKWDCYISGYVSIVVMAETEEEAAKKAAKKVRGDAWQKKMVFIVDPPEVVRVFPDDEAAEVLDTSKNAGPK